MGPPLVYLVFVPVLEEVIVVGAAAFAYLFSTTLLSTSPGSIDGGNEEETTHIWQGTPDEWNANYRLALDQEAGYIRELARGGQGGSSNLTQEQQHAINLQAAFDRHFRGESRRPPRIDEKQLRQFLADAGFTLQDKSGKERMAVHKATNIVLRLPNPKGSEGFSTSTIQAAINNLFQGGTSGTGASSSSSGASSSRR